MEEGEIALQHTNTPTPQHTIRQSDTREQSTEIEGDRRRSKELESARKIAKLLDGVPCRTLFSDNMSLVNMDQLSCDGSRYQLFSSNSMTSASVLCCNCSVLLCPQDVIVSSASSTYRRRRSSLSVPASLFSPL